MGNKVCVGNPEPQDMIQIPDQIHDKDQPDSYYARLQSIKYQIPCTVNHVFTDLPKIQYDQTIDRGKNIQNSYFLIPYSVYYTGQWKNGKPHGIGTLVFQNGTILKAIFVDGQVKGKDCLLVIDDGSYYRGNIQNNCLCGKGVFVEQSGHTYEGQWDHNVPHGHGKQKFANGDIYQGLYIDGKKKGENGRYIWNNHKNFVEYKGEFNDDYMYGSGELLKANGQSIIGTFRQNLIEDALVRGKYYEYRGEIRDGKFNGRGKMINVPLNTVYEGNFVDGQPHGQGRIILSNGAQKQGRWHKGRLIKNYKDLDNKQFQFLITIIEEQLELKQYAQDVVQSINYRLKTAGYEYKALLSSNSSTLGLNPKYLMIEIGNKNLIIQSK